MSEVASDSSSVEVCRMDFVRLCQASQVKAAAAKKAGVPAECVADWSVLCKGVITQGGTGKKKAESDPRGKEHIKEVKHTGGRRRMQTRARRQLTQEQQQHRNIQQNEKKTRRKQKNKDIACLRQRLGKLDPVCKQALAEHKSAKVNPCAEYVIEFCKEEMTSSNQNRTVVELCLRGHANELDETCLLFLDGQKQEQTARPITAWAKSQPAMLTASQAQECMTKKADQVSPKCQRWMAEELTTTDSTTAFAPLLTRRASTHGQARKRNKNRATEQGESQPLWSTDGDLVATILPLLLLLTVVAALWRYCRRDTSMRGYGPVAVTGGEEQIDSKREGRAGSHSAEAGNRKGSELVALDDFVVEGVLDFGDSDEPEEEESEDLAGTSQSRPAGGTGDTSDGLEPIEDELLEGVRMCEG